jgi:phosphoribosylaminoimidazolecarboxamide formyltransferase/IMP cyclohydrolase
MQIDETAITQEGGTSPVGAPVRVERALVSVSDKTGIVDFARALTELDIEILSTGGTAAVLREAGIDVTDVAEFTGSPEILGGRVKTLHPRLHAALLARRDLADHMQTLADEGIEPIDLVCVNLYPFEETVAVPDVSEEEAVENIDIGGPTMIRAAAKNHDGIAVVVKPESYDAVIAELTDSDGEISAETRHWLANEAFAQIANYDAAISRWFGLRYEVFPTNFTISYEKLLDLSYGENPHQKAALYADTSVKEHILTGVGKLHGKDLSFNNVLDLDSARRLLAEFHDEPACVIVKHNNPCGVAVGASALEAYEKAFACDPLSAFGGVLVFNRRIDAALAERLSQQFIEVLLAPGFEEDALAILTRKEAIRILDVENVGYEPRARDLKKVRGGLLAQDQDIVEESRETMEVATVAQPAEEQWDDLLFAWKVCKHVRSNAIVFAKNGATVGIGAGQMSRVDSVRLAVEKCAEAFGEQANEMLRESVVASDAFFPFADGPQGAIDAGATAVIQPGGSKRDDEVIAACDAAGVAMVLTGRRHFRH